MYKKSRPRFRSVRGTDLGIQEPNDIQSNGLHGLRVLRLHTSKFLRSLETVTAVIDVTINGCPFVKPSPSRVATPRSLPSFSLLVGFPLSRRTLRSFASEANEPQGESETLIDSRVTRVALFLLLFHSLSHTPLSLSLPPSLSLSLSLFLSLSSSRRRRRIRRSKETYTRTGIHLRGRNGCRNESASAA